MKLSLGYITGRYEPRLDWFLDSLAPQMKDNDEFEIIVVDALHDTRRPEFYNVKSPAPIKFIPVKPNVWQGKHRLTPCEWFALSNARNTFVASAKYDWLVTMDDRMVLCGGWLKAVRAAHEGKYGVAGTYRKVVGLSPSQPTDFLAPNIEAAFHIDAANKGGVDHRYAMVGGSGIHPCTGSWWFGGTFSEATEWAMQTNGHCEDADGCALNDVLYGFMLANNGVHLKFDTRMAIVQDRTPELSGPYYVRVDKGISPNDKSHALLERCRYLAKCNNPFGDMRGLRDRILAGGDFPIPTGPTHDWYDGQPLADMKAA